MSDYIKYETPAKTRVTNLMEKDRGYITTEKDRQEALVWAILSLVEEQQKTNEVLVDIYNEIRIANGPRDRD